MTKIDSSQPIPNHPPRKHLKKQENRKPANSSPCPCPPSPKTCCFYHPPPSQTTPIKIPTNNHQYRPQICIPYLSRTISTWSILTSDSTFQNQVLRKMTKKGRKKERHQHHALIRASPLFLPPLNFPNWTLANPWYIYVRATQCPPSVTNKGDSSAHVKERV